MNSRLDLPGGPYLVVGLARSGQAAALALRERGERVIACDLGAPADAERLRAAGVEVHLETEGVELLDSVKSVIKSPGVPREAAVIVAALQRDLPVLGELELGWRLLPNEFTAVTGTNGKTTTAELIGHIYRTAGMPVAVCGNVGTPVTSLTVGPETTVVCEASSFQLEDTERFSPEVAVLLNITPDHIDRHGTLERYRAAKLRIFANQDPTDFALLPESLAELELGGRGQQIYFDSVERAEIVSGLRLRGEHNRQNAMAAAAAAVVAGVPTEAVSEGLRSFPGVPHRLEQVATAAGVLYVNDSKSTNISSTLAALSAFPAGVHLILGGQGKGVSFQELREPIEQRCAAVYLIGEAADQIERELVDTAIPLHRCGELERAVTEASAAAASGEVVLLSPACASFDQFSSYEQRGERFRELVGELS